MANGIRSGLLAAGCALLIAMSAQAYDQPAVNLGFTSFLDGGPPAGAGWYVTQYGQFYTADRFADLPFPGRPELDAWIGLSQVIYQSDQIVAGTARWGMNFMLPYAAFDLKARGTPLRANDGVGDLLVGPFMQWDPVMGPTGPVFVQRVEFQILLPTGDYDREYAINPGSYTIGLNPYWAATWFFAPQWSASWRLHYLWNDRNDKPNIPDPEIRTTQAGQSVHANFAADHEVLEQRLRVGVNGYVFKQVEDSRVNGRRVSGGREQVAAVGPGLVWHIDQDRHVFANVYFEMEAKNRTEGQRFNLRYVHHF